MRRIRRLAVVVALFRHCATFCPSTAVVSKGRSVKVWQESVGNAKSCGVELREILLEGGASETELSEMAIALGSSVSSSSSFAGGESSIKGAYIAAEILMKRGFSGGEVAIMLSQCPRQLCAPNAAIDLSASLDYLKNEAGLKNRELRRIAKLRPQVLVRRPEPSPPLRDTGACPAVLATVAGGPIANSSSSPVDIIGDIIFFLQGVGLRDRRIRELLVRWPQILTIEMPQLLAVTDFLSGLGFSTPATTTNHRKKKEEQRQTLSALYRQAPWLLAAGVGSQLRPAADFLRYEAGVSRLDLVISAFPRCLLLDPERDLRPRLFAFKRYGVTEPGKVIETFPLVLGLDVREQMDPVVTFWLDDLGIHKDDLPKICRAFPSLLGVDVDTMRHSVEFLREIGVQNIARFVTRLPPVLAYDVDSVLRPKMTFAVQNALSIYDVVRFPAYFSYPLDQVIEPRAAFLQRYDPPSIMNPKPSPQQQKNIKKSTNHISKRPSYSHYSNTPIPLASIGLSRVLTPSDDSFAKLANASPQEYAAFKQRFLQQRQQDALLRASTPAPDTTTNEKNSNTSPLFFGAASTTTTTKNQKQKKDTTTAEKKKQVSRKATGNKNGGLPPSSDQSPLPFPPLLRFPR